MSNFKTHEAKVVNKGFAIVRLHTLLLQNVMYFLLWFSKLWQALKKYIYTHEMSV